MSPASPIFHTEATVNILSNNNKINCLTLFQLLFGKQERVNTDFQTEVKTLIHLPNREENKAG